MSWNTGAGILRTMSSSLLRAPAVLVLGALAISCCARTEVLDARAVLDDAIDAGSVTDDAGAPFPVDTFTRCAFGTVSAGSFLLASGFDDGATLTVAQSGDGRTATFADTGHTDRWTFAPTTRATATLSPSGQRASGLGSGVCAHGVGVSNETFFPTIFDAAAGAMTYQAGTVFLSLAGALTSDTDCGQQSAPASVWIGCADGPALGSDAPASTTPFPVGDFTCTSQVGTRATLPGGQRAFFTSGGTGALTLTQRGSQVTATYAGDAELSGSIDFVLSAAGAGTGSAPQSLDAQCEGVPMTGVLSVSAASLTAVDGTVFVSFSGAMSADGACPGAEKIASLVCTRT